MTASSDLYFQQIPVGEMANLAYLIGSRATREALLVDPAWSVDALLDQAEADGMRVTGALVTHYHQDHVGGEIFGMNIEGSDASARASAGADLRERARGGGAAARDGDLGLGRDTEASRRRDRARRLRVRLLHTPGHTPGSQCFLVEESGQPGRLVSGDTLFLGSCGRVDLPGSDVEAMYQSLNGTLKRAARRDAALPRPPLLARGGRHARTPEAQQSLPARHEPRAVPDVHGRG